MSAPYDLAAVRARSDLLSQISHICHVTFEEAQRLTGLTGAELVRLTETGTVLAEYNSRGYGRFCTDTLLRLLRRRGEPLSLCDVLRTAAADGCHLTEDELAVDEACTRDRRDLQTRGARCYRLLRRDHVVPTAPAWAAWYQGRTGLAQELLQGERERFAAERTAFAARSLTLTTLWVPSRPLTWYGRYMLAALDHAHQVGQRVRVQDPYQVRHLEADAPLPEFTVYEATVVYLRTYTELGRRDGALKIEDPDLATHLCEQMRTLCWQAQAFEDFRGDVA
ncbi:hypothetical protein HNR06_000938 [Nocardiopsis arvandica]|uniref:DUF6879 domain-containing protein n=1 Tax=Nocardiopsis sinuspersici TaxID=501010 RepID=A0A7Z0BJG2_9ACTN|nr:DUF6879 family protein [Nocardiopsis sinuspersici]NYH51349.1 hypothetical protein [Nocardiopsis sinuspersici]